MSSFAVLATLGKKKSKKPVAAVKDEKAAGPQRTAAQLAIIDQQHKERIAQKAAKAAAREVASRCFYFATCGNKHESDWEYCRACYNSHFGACATCGGPTTLSSEGGGKFHENCAECRV